MGARIIVKVQRPLYGGQHPREAMVYAEGRKRVRHMILTPAQVALMGGLMRCFFDAEWTDDQWLLHNRASEQGW